MNIRDKLSIISYILNFGIVLYILKIAITTRTLFLSNVILSFLALFISMILNIIGIIVTLKRAENKV